jgi:4-aminobutyrate aminotransferase
MKSLIERDSDVFLHQTGSTPLAHTFHAVDGIWAEDINGHRFMDFHGNTCHNIGYKHPRLVANLKAQLECLPFTPRRFTNEPAVVLAERLARLWPHGRGRVLFGLSGTDAVEMAIKLAYIATGRKRSMAFQNSWHGAALGALWVGGRPNDRIGFPQFGGCHHVRPFWPEELSDDRETAAAASIGAVNKLFKEVDGFAFFLTEPIRSTPHIPPKWYWPEIRKLCDQYGTLLIFDEIPTGLGKTGRWFSSQHFEAAPDMTILGKSLGGAAVPLSAVIARDALNVAEPWAIGHYTHQKNPLLCRAGLTVLDILEEENLVERTAREGAYALAQMNTLAEESPFFCGARGIGLLMALEIDTPAAAPALQRACFEKGLNVTLAEGGRFLCLSPPMTIKRADLEHARAIIQDAVGTVLP